MQTFLSYQYDICPRLYQIGSYQIKKKKTFTESIDDLLGVAECANKVNEMNLLQMGHYVKPAAEKYKKK